MTPQSNSPGKMDEEMLRAHTFQQLLSAASDRFGDQAFLLDDPALGSLSYTDVLRFATGLDAWLDKSGVPPGAYVATLLHNCGLAALLFLSIIACRRVLVPINPLSSQYELDYALDRARCVAVIADPAHARATDHGARKTLLVPNHRAFFNNLCSHPNNSSATLLDWDRDDVFAGEVVFTSGSTGRPKGIVLSERSLLVNASSLARVYDLRRGDRFLTVCPLFHNSGQVFTTLACAMTGGSTVAIKSDVGMLKFWSYVNKYQVHWAFGMNSFLALLLSKPEGPKHPEILRALLTGGSAIDGSLVERFETRFKVPIRTVYGLTETSSISTCEFLDPEQRSLGSSGRPLPTCQVAIDPQRNTDETRSHRSQGEIWIAGPHLFEWYIGDMDLTLRRKHGGWLRTGDVGYYDENGNLFVVDRSDSMLIVGGENVYPAEIEKLGVLLPNAGEVIVTGVDHAIWGKELVLVYKVDGDASPSTAVWHRILAENLSAAKIPQRYVSISDLELEDFPRKANGKLDRPAIASLVSGHVRSADRHR